MPENLKNIALTVGRKYYGGEIMGEFWTRYLMDNGQRISKRQSKKVTRLEEEILECMVTIDHLEELIKAHSDEIARIKKGGKRQPTTCSENENNF